MNILLNKQKIVMRQVSFILLVLFISCASTNRYAYDRTMDARDIFNVGIERNIYGVSFAFFFGVLGIQKAANGKGLGLRFGHIGTYDTGDGEEMTLVSYYTETEKVEDDFYKVGDNWYFWGSYFHRPTGDVSDRNSKKSFRFAGFYKCYNKTTIYYKGSNYKCGISGDRSYSPNYLLEISFGVYIGVRAGINLGELVDFFAGIVGYDLKEDDTVVLDPETIYFNLPQVPPKPNKE